MQSSEELLKNVSVLLLLWCSPSSQPFVTQNREKVQAVFCTRECLLFLKASLEVLNNVEVEGTLASEQQQNQPDTGGLQCIYFIEVSSCIGKQRERDFFLSAETLPQAVRSEEWQSEKRFLFPK